MSDPTSAAAAAATAGAGAFFLALTGLEPQALVWGIVGGVIGLSLAPPASRLRAGMTFLAVAFASAALGTLAAEYWHAGSRFARNGWSMSIAALFHPIFEAAVKAVPAAVSAVFARKAGGQ